jgi:hypothetical protein
MTELWVATFNTLASDNDARRLRAAGYVYIPGGWMPRTLSALAVANTIKQHRPAVDAIRNEPPKPRGRPRKEADLAWDVARPYNRD